MQLPSTNCDFAISGHWPKSGDIFGCHSWKGDGADPWCLVVETRETDYIPYHAQGSPRDTQLLAVNINSTD